MKRTNGIFIYKCYQCETDIYYLYIPSQCTQKIRYLHVNMSRVVIKRIFCEKRNKNIFKSII